MELNNCYFVDDKPDFSQIYGTKRSDIVNLVGQEQATRLTLDYIKRFPNSIRVGGLRKAKSKYMLEALVHGIYEGGNHFMTCYGYVFHFYYRGTVIFKWNAVTNKGEMVNAGQYEHTASTYNQRKEIAKAIQNFNEAVSNL